MSNRRLRRVLSTALALGLFSVAAVSFTESGRAAQSALNRVRAASESPLPGTDSAGSPSPQTLSQASANVHFTVTWLNYSGQYQLQFESLTTLGTVTALTWTPPPSLAVTAITSTSGGICTITATGGISCQTSLSPPPCSGDTCYPARSLLTVDFTASLTGNPPGSTFASLFWGSYLQVTGLTPTSPAFNDLPFCAKGQVSTKHHLCVPRPRA
jgi:hypothetical protein